MKIIKRTRGLRYIMPSEGEATEEILKAIARASFEIAESEDVERNRKLLLDLDWAGVRPELNWKRVLRGVRKFDADAPVGETLLHMDYVDAVRCKTTVKRGRKYLHLHLYGGRENEADMVAELAAHYVRQRCPRSGAQ